MSRVSKKTAPSKPPPIDGRKQLFNDCACGKIESIQLPLDEITQLRGILFDLDPPHYRRSALLPKVPVDPAAFYKQVVKPWLDRHPVLSKSQVRNTGRGVHAILWLDAPVVFATAEEREKWAGIVQVVQAALPIDPHQPGITATTRLVNSTNSKNGAKVTQPRMGTPVTEAEVMSLFEQMCSAPFRTVFSILAGADNISPCPLCNGDDTKLAAGDYVGHCYACGKIKLDQLYDLVFAAPSTPKNAGSCHVKNRK